MRIQNNLMAMNTHRQLGSNQIASSKSTEKLSSGLRINRAADDAAGLSISEKMRAQIRGLNRASSNAQDGISLIQAAEGALQESHSILQRVRELAVQGANDVNASEDRVAIKGEIDQLGLELDRIATSTNFNGKYILSGLYAKEEPDSIPAELGDEGLGISYVGAINIQVGANTLSSDTIQLNLSGVSAKGLLGDVWVDPQDKSDVQADEAFFPTSGPVIPGIEEAANAETGASSIVGFQALLNVIDGKTPEGEVLDADTLPTGIALVNDLRSNLGSIQNRLEHTISNVDTIAENMQAAESRIRDVDMAREMMRFTTSNILNQAATAMLAQANQAPQSVLSLLK